MWDNYAILADLHMHPMQCQVALFLHSISPNVLKIYNSMGVMSTEAANLKAMMKFTDFSIGDLFINLFIWGFTSLSTLYRSYHDG